MNNPAEELFDIVDEKDKPLGYTMPRAIVHQDHGHWHRVTAVIIINSKKEILCQQRSLQKDIHPGQWQLNFGGHVKAGETYDQNIVSELEEELGLKVSLSDLIPLGKVNTQRHKHIAMLYAYHWEGSIDDLVFNDGEVQQVIRVTLSKYMKMIENGEQIVALNPKFIEYINSLQ